jgi:hypothetical protein
LRVTDPILHRVADCLGHAIGNGGGAGQALHDRGVGLLLQAGTEPRAERQLGADAGHVVWIGALPARPAEAGESLTLAHTP